MWLRKNSTWPNPSMGMVLGCGLSVFKDTKNKPHSGTSRLYKILVSESAHLIWKLRCECVIGRDGVPPTVSEVQNRWFKNLSLRLEIDINLTNRLKYGKEYSIPPSVVQDTWSGTLLEEEKLPENWPQEPGVLVSIAPMRLMRSLSPPAGRRGRNR
ncbi:hypothetical protein C8J57DRAFT_1079502 [Mycena rebaudengoi]|nr:hypothetical protein C8J57DRAFT_1079502 [Mycena rebaudengoi]